MNPCKSLPTFASSSPSSPHTHLTRRVEPLRSGTVCAVVGRMRVTENNCRKQSWCRRIREQGECRKQPLTIPQRNSEEEQARDPLLGTLFIGHMFFQPNLGACRYQEVPVSSLLQGLKCVFLFHPPPQPLNSVPTREGSTPTVLVGMISLPGAPLQPGAFPSPHRQACPKL